MKHFITTILSLFFGIISIYATDYHVGPGQNYTSISAVPWESLVAGDHVYIHWRSNSDGGAYKEKWVINIAGTESKPFTVSGVLGPNGERPVIDGNGATTRSELNYWSEVRGVLKIGGSSIPANDTPSYIVVENLEIRSGHPDYNFINDSGGTEVYKKNAASIYIENGNNITIRNCVLYDSGLGLFSAHETNDLLIEKNHLFGNGNVGSIYEHNSYTETINITFQYNHYGPLREGASGNNLKDRSAGLVVRYNWIEGGNRLLDLVESDFAAYYENPVYRKTYVYGNILVEKDGGNRQVIHYGGDNGTETYYRKGKLYLYNNTLYSVRAGNTTLVRLSTNDESADIRNNILYVTANGNRLAILDDTGNAVLRNNWLKSGWINTPDGSLSGSIDADDSNVEGNEPGFKDASQKDFYLTENSPCINKGSDLLNDVLPANNVTMEYLHPQNNTPRNIVGKLDIGCFEYIDGSLGVNTRNLKNNPIKMFPVPVKNTLNINDDFFKPGAGRIFSINGKTVLAFTVFDNKIDVSSLKHGIYFLELNTIKGKITTKILKE